MKNIKVLGAEMCSSCSNLKDHIEKFVKDNNVEATVEKITDIAVVMSYGVMSAPAVVVDEEVKCFGRSPSDDELKEWILK
ncbi:MAG: thioredoxin family protein [Alphaproteobacteria bacterium]|jgi:small redox-active disulfide protein 2|nr:thioredoxin family protein [Alphaproteobacteria bacterium]